MPRQISEELTRKEMIDPQLETASWYLHGQSIFLQKSHLETADTLTLPSVATQRLYEPPMDMFGADAVERWFTSTEIQDAVDFANKLGI